MPPRSKLKVDSFDRKVCHDRGLTDATIRRNGLYTEGGKLKIRYRDLDGSENGFIRDRYHNPRIIDGKPRRYNQPPGSKNRAYFPVDCLKKLRDSKDDIHIVEGELKSLALAQLKLCVVAIGGIWNWVKKDTNELIPDLQEIDLTGRVIYIVFDFDDKAETRQTVDLARRRLAKALRAAGAEEVYCVVLPPGPDGAKQGVDDFLLSKGKQAYLDLVEQAQLVSEDRISSIDFISLTPPTLGEAAYFGIMGEFIKAVSPHTEATDAGILGHLIPLTAAIIGPVPTVYGGDYQPVRFNTVISGPTATGRKGTASSLGRRLIGNFDPKFLEGQYVSGLSTGEGVIAKVSDKKIKNDHDEWETVEVDKRLYVLEVEFSKVLMQIRRDGNILSPVIRECFDSGNLGILTRSNPLQVRGAHVCITAHITPEELKKRFSQIEMANGFGNRFLWFVSRSFKELPCAKPISSKLISKFSKRLGEILEFTARQKLVKLDPDAEELWVEAYSALREDRPGLTGALTARGETIVLRLSLLYALLDQSKTIRVEHLEAALAVWRYNIESVAILFGDKTGDSLSDKLYQLLGNGPMKTKEFHSHMNKTGAEIRAALQQLERSGRVSKSKSTQTGRGRPAETWQRV